MISAKNGFKSVINIKGREITIRPFQYDDTLLQDQFIKDITEHLIGLRCLYLSV